MTERHWLGEASYRMMTDFSRMPTGNLAQVLTDLIRLNFPEDRRVIGTMREEIKRRRK